MASTTAASTVRLKSVAIPPEHGSWGFLLEPIALGLLVAPSGYGALLGLSMFAVFFLHQPLKVMIKDRIKGRRPERTVWAERFTLGYGAIALFTFGIVSLNNDSAFLMPLLLSAPLLMTQVVYDLRNMSRELVAEVTGASALGAIAPAIALLGGMEAATAWVLWPILLARTIPSILYIRARLRLQRGHAVPIVPVWVIHGIGILSIAAFVWEGRAPWLALVALGILIGRMALGLSRYRKAHRTAIIGVQEMTYGFLTVILVAIGYALMK